MNKELEIIFKLWDLEEEWERIADPQFTWYGNMTFHKPNDVELFRMVAIQDEEKKLEKELRQKIGLWNYLKYTINPLKFTKSLPTNPIQ